MYMKDIYNIMQDSKQYYPTVNNHLINNFIEDILRDKNNLTEEQVDELKYLLYIGNITYNNSTISEADMPIEDGVYDILLEIYKSYVKDFQVGSDLLVPQVLGQSTLETKNIPRELFRRSHIDDVASMFLEELEDIYVPGKNDLRQQLFRQYSTRSKKYTDQEHTNIDLVGSLDKCKFVLNKQAQDKGVLDDRNVKVFERDFIGRHYQDGILPRIIEMCLELKYDGVSVVGSIVNSHIEKAESRGDVNAGKTADLTPILYGYYFPNLPKNIALDCKFEAVMTYMNLQAYNEVKGKNYANCRTAIIGLLGSNDGFSFQKYVTLVPISVAPSSLITDAEWTEMDRRTEIEFINKYLASGEKLRHCFVHGTYEEILFAVYTFAKEAEAVREYLPIMYDGIVASYTDKFLMRLLGRENFINKYSMAIKFNALRKNTVFLDYEFSIGQDGSITPMAHFKPVEFMGSIQPKQTLSSYGRFKELNLVPGDIIEVEYVNDVLTYINGRVSPKQDIDAEFPIYCPSCNTEIIISKSGMSAYCPNFYCPEIMLQRLTNMLDKLGMKDFDEQTVYKLINVFGISSLEDIYEKVTHDTLCNIIGEINASKFFFNINTISTTPTYDYILIGSLGFTNIAQGTWKKIFYVYTLDEILEYYYNYELGQLKEDLLKIKYIGEETAHTIMEEMELFAPDMNYIRIHFNIINSKGVSQKKIRITGIRDQELLDELNILGYDASDKGVTKDTFILLIPYEGFESSKTKHASPNTLIIPIQEFRDNMKLYLD